jgi:hypothetical protein
MGNAETDTGGYRIQKESLATITRLRGVEGESRMAELDMQII